MKVPWLRPTLIGLVVVGFAGISFADPLPIKDVQYTEDPSGESPYSGTFQDVTGGVVTHIKGGGAPQRYYLQDPTEMAGWGAICIKDWTGDLGTVQVGDWVSLTDVYIEDHRGTTFVQYDLDSGGANPALGFNVDSTGNPVPDPIVLTAADLAAPVEDPTDYWLVDDRSAEPYESMLVTLEDVTVGQVGNLGKADDNYELWQGTDVAWGTDYFSAPDYDPFYHPGIVQGTELESITGLVEQYLKSGTGYGWDYYQLCTRGAYDVVVPEPGTLALLMFGVAVVIRRTRGE